MFLVQWFFQYDNSEYFIQPHNTYRPNDRYESMCPYNHMNFFQHSPLMSQYWSLTTIKKQNNVSISQNNSENKKFYLGYSPIN